MAANAIGSHAIVIGGGIAGLLSARALIDHFEHVTLIERDHYPHEPVFRPGVPQARHLHVLLVRGQQIVETLFPGIRAKLIARGAIELDFCNDCSYYTPTGWMPRFPSRLKGYSLSRPLLEWQIYQELKTHYPVKLIEGHEVVELLANTGAQCVTGVRMRARTHTAPAENETTDLAADLIVDASGRTSRASQWLESLGYAPPAETVINAFLGYASRLFAPSSDPNRTWKGIIVNANPPHNLRAGGIWPIENGAWTVLMAGSNKDYPPTEEDAFLDFSSTLPDNALYEALKGAQPLTPVSSYRSTENRLRHFEHLARQPEGFIAIGDTVCAFNPIYGQGMTVASLSALVLSESLSQQRRVGLPGFSQRFQRQLAKVHALPWQLASSSDFRFPGTVGVAGRKTGRAARWMQQYTDDVLRILPMSTTATRAFLEVVHMISSPTALFHLAIMLKVFTHGRSKL
jgi:2-polyprenyl-6-methoxyphenol hydroxylase-like FAD-dependent oxidoreductase